MGAGVTVDRDVPGDSRYQLLAAELGLANHYEAIGRMVVLWGVCTELMTDRPPKGRIVACLGKNALEALTAADLGELMPDGEFRIKGCLGRIEWYSEELRKRSAGGRARAATAKRAGGKFAPAGEPLDQQPPATDQRAGEPLVLQLATAGDSEPATTSKNQLKYKNKNKDKNKDQSKNQKSAAVEIPPGRLEMRRAVSDAWFEGFERLHGHKPEWGGREVRATDELLTRAGQFKIVERIGTYFASPLGWWPHEHWTFLKFAANFDKLAAPPRSSSAPHVGRVEPLPHTEYEDREVQLGR